MFGNKELPDELKGLGLTPAQIVEAINSKKLLEDKIKLQDGEIGTLKQSIETNTGEFRTLKEKLDTLEANGRREEKTPLTVERTSFLADEDKAFTERFLEGVGPVAMAAAQANAKSAKILAKSMLSGQTIKTSTGVISLAKLWDKWISEIDAASKNVPITNLGDEGTWINLFDYIKGRHFEELMSKPETFIEPVSTGVNVTVGDRQDPEKLNDEQTAIANKMARYGKGVTPERILEMRKKMNFVGDNA